MGKRAGKINPVSYTDNLARQKSKDFYQTKDWKRLREKYRKKKRKEHEQIIMDIYKRNPKNDPKELAKFLKSDMPLSEKALKKDLIKVASVCDHKMRITKGGARLSMDNLQWLTEAEHNRKSAREAHED